MFLCLLPLLWGSVLTRPSCAQRVGEQAKVLNYVIEHWSEMPEEMKQKKRLKTKTSAIRSAGDHGHAFGTAIRFSAAEQVLL